MRSFLLLLVVLALCVSPVAADPNTDALAALALAKVPAKQTVAGSIEPCKACVPMKCGPEVCKAFGCEVGQCLTPKAAAKVACSGACTCGCQDGLLCDCAAKTLRLQQPAAPAPVTSTPDPFQSYAPTYRSSAGASGSSCGPRG